MLTDIKTFVARAAWQRLALTLALLSVIWIAGGASRADALGQTVVRAAAGAALVVAALAGRRPALGLALPALFGSIVVLALAHVVLPVALRLPATSLLPDVLPWPPGGFAAPGALNALFSLLVPAAMLVALGQMSRDDRARLLTPLLVLMAVATLVGLLQVSGAGFDNPLVNDTPGAVSGQMANRNHFALVLAVGCLLIPGWVFRASHNIRLRGLLGLAGLIMMVLIILATGSRAGILLAGLAIVIGLAITWRELAALPHPLPRWVGPVLVIALLGVVAVVVLVSLAADRAISIDRLFAEDVTKDMRQRALPTVLAMIRDAFPLGIGLGRFEPLFRMNEPFELLKPTYFNQVHNDYLQVVLETGVPGIVLILAAVIWWGWASIRAWWTMPTPHARLSRIGSGILLLVMVASVFDYPARTPIVMVLVVIAATWLSDTAARAG